MVLDVRTTGWVGIEGSNPPLITCEAKAQVVVTFPQRRGTQRMKETLLIRENAVLPLGASPAQMAVEEQRVADRVAERIRVLCEHKAVIPDGARRPVQLGRPVDNFTFVDVEPADMVAGKILEPEETHQGLPNEQLYQEYVPKKPMIILGH